MDRPDKNLILRWWQVIVFALIMVLGWASNFAVSQWRLDKAEERIAKLEDWKEKRIQITGDMLVSMERIETYLKLLCEKENINYSK